MPSRTPRVYIFRHGETEGSVSGRYIGKSDAGLTEKGVKQVQNAGKVLIGKGKLVDPKYLAHVYVSPRYRAKQTFELAFSEDQKQKLRDAGKVTETPRLAEWDYGDYEGLTTKEILALRKTRGFEDKGHWNLWSGGCEGGESTQQITERLDSLIEEIHGYQRDNMRGDSPSDILLIAHGHLLRALIKRWLRQSLDFPVSLMLEPGAIGTLSYQAHKFEFPALYAGTVLPFDEVE
ncbi:phosphoglycerate mutase-like protein [Zopfia rhizophila CBS 207.26]|uniref:Phosphoglycerate mutase-like protein n=1 Tax=Zopfia rhizophila CBS 207.26 TaxID=1314779 RepID=A0A6A6E469_9PEZI|nr:phosphoglycerate mutase-like protein [Zopfia rhizophila CBS 207.26]